MQTWHTPFPVWNQSIVPHLVVNCYFLTCIQISQETGQVLWYYHLLKNFAQCVVIHTVKGFRIVNKVEIDIFMEFSCFISDPSEVGNLISNSSTFSKYSLPSGSSQFMYCWSLAWRILSKTFLAWEMNAIVPTFFGFGHIKGLKTTTTLCNQVGWKKGEKKRKHDGISIPCGELKERRDLHTQESPFTVGGSAGTEKELQGIRQECSNWSVIGRTE